MAYPVIVKVTLNHREIESFVLEKDRVLVGRDPGCDIFLDNPGVSRQHLSIEMTPGVIQVRDLASANGTLLNGQSVTLAEVSDGDVLGVGRFDLHLIVPRPVASRQRREDGKMPPSEPTLEVS